MLNLLLNRRQLWAKLVVLLRKLLMGFEQCRLVFCNICHHRPQMQIIFTNQLLVGLYNFIGVDIRRASIALMLFRALLTAWYTAWGAHFGYWLVHDIVIVWEKHIARLLRLFKENKLPLDNNVPPLVFRSLKMSMLLRIDRKVHDLVVVWSFRKVDELFVPKLIQLHLNVVLIVSLYLLFQLNFQVLEVGLINDLEPLDPPDELPGTVFDSLEVELRSPHERGPESPDVNILLWYFEYGLLVDREAYHKRHVLQISDLVAFF